MPQNIVIPGGQVISGDDPNYNAYLNQGGWTYAPTTPTTPPTPPPPTPGNQGVQYNPDGTRVLTGIEKEIADYYASLAPKSPAEIAAQEERIRQTRLQEQQQAIFGVNQMYDNLLAQINKDNQGRLGSTASINALSGNRGSASGAANEDNTRVANAKIVSANEAERNAKINQIMSGYKAQIDAEILKARELRTADANAYITYKQGELERNKQVAVDLRKQFITAGIKPEDLGDDVYKEIASKGGYTLDQAKALYKAEYDSGIKSFTDAEAKRLAELDKTKAETENLRATAASKSPQAQLIDKGYTYVSTIADRDKLKAQGRILVQEGGRTYVAPSTLKTKVITIGNTQVLINTDTGEQIKSLGPKPAGVGNNSSDKNYTATTIPTALKAEVLSDKKNGATVDEMMAAYPEVSTSYIQSLYRDPNSGFTFE